MEGALAVTKCSSAYTEGASGRTDTPSAQPCDGGSPIAVRRDSAEYWLSPPDVKKQVTNRHSGFPAP